MFNEGPDWNHKHEWNKENAAGYEIGSQQRARNTKKKNQPEILETRNMSQIKSSVGSPINSMKQGDDRTLNFKARWVRPWYNSENSEIYWDRHFRKGKCVADRYRRQEKDLVPKAWERLFKGSQKIVANTDTGGL